MSSKKHKVMVAMSGGVDSSAVCMMLRDEGYEVEGMTMRVWDLPRHFPDWKGEAFHHGRIPSDDEPDFIVKARELARTLGIRHQVVDIRDAFRKDVVQHFIDEYLAGRTPNPCVRCNPHFKFRCLQETADLAGCDFMATGHYVKTIWTDGNAFLQMGDDDGKDQSYFLWRVPQETLRRCLFPLGRMKKAQVRAYLEKKGFHTCARQGESMEVCFVEGDYRDFLRTQCPGLEELVAGGNFTDNTGRKLGTHKGVPFYTVGQRKGLGIALGHPAYVLRLNAEKNTVVLGTEEELLTRWFLAGPLESPCPETCLANLSGGEKGTSTPLSAQPPLSVRVRYHSHPVPCTVMPLEDGRLLIHTQEAVSAVTPGQSAVFYRGERLVGGAVIDSQKGLGKFIAEHEPPTTTSIPTSNPKND